MKPLGSRGFQAIAKYDLHFLEDRFAGDFPAYASRFGECVGELRRLLMLPLHTSEPLAVMSHGVDSLWHTFITHTPQYHEFCDDAYGQYLHHQPRSEQFPVPLAAIGNFYSTYPRHFGKAPDIWLEDIPPAHIIAVRHGKVPSELQRLRWSGWPGWEH